MTSVLRKLWDKTAGLFRKKTEIPEENPEAQKILADLKDALHENKGDCGEEDVEGDAMDTEEDEECVYPKDPWELKEFSLEMYPTQYSGGDLQKSKCVTALHGRFWDEEAEEGLRYGNDGEVICDECGKSITRFFGVPDWNIDLCVECAKSIQERLYWYDHRNEGEIEMMAIFSTKPMEKCAGYFLYKGEDNDYLFHNDEDNEHLAKKIADIDEEIDFDLFD